jgi:hypothetical protein
MQSRQIMQVVYGFVLTAVLALGPPLALLMIPGMGFFWLLLPIWSIGVICLLILGFSISGRFFYAIGVAVLAVTAALSPLGKLSMMSAGAVGQAVETNKFVLRELQKNCATGLAPLKKASGKHGVLIFENITTSGEQDYDIADSVAVLTGMRVVEITRWGHENRFDKAWETTFERSNSCVWEPRSDKVRVSPRGSQRGISPLTVKGCLRHTEIPVASRNDTPAIILRNSGNRATGCYGTDVVERMAGAEIDLGRVHYDSYHQRFYPPLSPPKGIPQNNWVQVLLAEVLQQDLSDKALLALAIKTKK